MNHIYCVDQTREVTWVIAESEDEAVRFMAELEEVEPSVIRRNDDQPITITQVPDDQPFSLLDDRGKKQKRLASEWCSDHAKGILCGSWT